MDNKKSFVFGVPVADYNFVGREEEIRRLKADFTHGINVILMSPRRIGKTSLVKHVLEDINRDDILVVYMDIFGCKTEYEVYNKFAAAVLSQTANNRKLWLEEAKNFIYRLTPKISVSPYPTMEFSVSLGITPKTHTPEEILSLPEKIAQKKGKHVLVCIDEFQQIGELPNSFSVQAVMRGVWQLQQHTSYCLFGSKHHLMASIFLNKSMPFYQFGELMSLQRIPEATWVSYIVSHFKDGERAISAKQAESICQFVGNYSSYVQQLSWLVFTQSKEGETISDELIQSCFKSLLDINEALFMQQVEPLSEYQMNFLRAIADGVHNNFTFVDTREEYRLGSYANISRLKTALVKADLVEGRKGELYITDPVFEKWIKYKMSD